MIVGAGCLDMYSWFPRDVCPLPGTSPEQGAFRALREGVMVIITSPDMLLTVPQAAEVAGVKPDRIRKWDRRGHLERAGLNERGWPLYRALDVAKCQHRFAGHGHGERVAA